MERWNLSGKKALVTGGTKGIGLGIVKEFIDLGATILVISRNQTDLENLQKKYGKQHVEVFAADLSRLDDCLKIVRHTNNMWGKLDILINNAGMNIRKKMHEYSHEEYDRVINTNLRPAFELSRLLLPLLTSNQGCIVNISSVAGVTHLRTGAIYGMTKAALIQLTKNQAAEWAVHGIRVNAVAPWYISTPLAMQVLQNETYKTEVLNRTPMKKIGDVEDVAAAVAFLCMPGATFITGQCLNVDGGFSIYGF